MNPLGFFHTHLSQCVSHLQCRLSSQEPAAPGQKPFFPSTGLDWARVAWVAVDGPKIVLKHRPMANGGVPFPS